LKLQADLQYQLHQSFFPYIFLISRPSMKSKFP
jgi:hypothetical protein